MGLGPMTSAVTGRRSNQLSHQAKYLEVLYSRTIDFASPVPSKPNTEKTITFVNDSDLLRYRFAVPTKQTATIRFRISIRPISISQLNASRHLHS